MEKNKTNWLKSKNAFKVFSVILAFICWFFVVTTGTTTRTETVKNIPVNFDLQKKMLAEVGLDIIEVSDNSISAEVTGERVAIGKVTPEDLVATFQLPSDFSGPDNTYKLELIPQNSASLLNKNYKIEAYTPSYITVKLDRIEKKVIPITVKTQGEIKLAEGYIQKNDMVLTPNEIVVSGPKVELDKVESAIIEISIQNELVSNYAAEHAISLLDAQGNKIDIESGHLSVDYDSVQAVIQVLKEAQLPLSIEFVNVPRNFPVENLKFTLSNKNISVAGPTDVMDRYNEIVLGYVDVSQLSINKTSFSFDITLPNKVENMENIETATVKFDSNNWDQTTINAEDINIVNIPDGYDVTLVTNQVPNVLMVGEKDSIANLSSEDLVAELDLAEKRDMTAGQYQYKVNISAPAKGLVWANGDYNVVIKVVKTEKES